MSVWSIAYCLARPICPPNSPNNLGTWLTCQRKNFLGWRKLKMDGDTLSSGAGIFKQSVGVRNRVGIGLSYRPAWLHSLAELVSWNWFLGSLNVLKFWLCALKWWRKYSRGGPNSCATAPPQGNIDYNSKISVFAVGFTHTRMCMNINNLHFT
jgi:hypothetical protein